MLVRSVSLKNIRSYNDGSEVEVRIPEGTVLFEGDIGSGKSTLLYAMEFALFGLSDIKGSYLLSEGRKQGHAELLFDAEGRTYAVRRGLRRKGEDVVQDECSISADGREPEKLSPSDLKERVVSILKFNEPTHPKAESLVFRFAVFTPQEQMKQILTQNAEFRLQVIRRVLGAQSYQVAASNSEIVERKLKEMAYGLKRATEDLDSKKEELASLGKALAELDAALPKLSEAANSASTRLDHLESEWRELRDEREEAKTISSRIPTLRKQLRELEGQQLEDSQALQEEDGRLKLEIIPWLESFEKREKPRGSSKALDVELGARRSRLADLRATKEAVDASLVASQEAIAKGECPFCGQQLPRQFTTRSEHARGESQRLEKQVEALQREVEALAEESSYALEYEVDLRQHGRQTKEKAAAVRRVSTLNAHSERRAERISELNAELDVALAKADSMKTLAERIETLESERRVALEESRKASKDLIEAQTRKVDGESGLKRLGEEVARGEQERHEQRRLESYHSWLAGFFRPTVEMIEKETLVHANERFNHHFQRFFTSLVDDPDLLVHVREDFSPVFERQGYEQEFDGLSGGERTSLALAYRFALNCVVKEDISSQTELVILDEPTDGFSRDQVYKMRDLLKELDSRQVILVSHERELESMADKVFRVEKNNGTSRVTGA